MTFRPLYVDDLPQMLPLGHLFFKEAGLPGTFNPEFFASTWRHLFVTGVGRATGAFEGDALVGCCGFVVSPDMNTGDLVAGETFFFVHKDKRGCGKELLDAAEGTLLGKVSRILLMHLEGPTAPVLERFYRRRGYVPIERVYVKNLS